MATQTVIAYQIVEVLSIQDFIVKRFIGKGGRNIRQIEKATGANIRIDPVPETETYEVKIESRAEEKVKEALTRVKEELKNITEYVNRSGNTSRIDAEETIEYDNGNGDDPKVKRIERIERIECIEKKKSPVAAAKGNNERRRTRNIGTETHRGGSKNSGNTEQMLIDFDVRLRTLEKSVFGHYRV